MLFLLFTNSPNMIQKLWRISWKTLNILKETPPIRRETSTSNAWLIGSIHFIDWMPGISPTILSAVNFLLKESTSIIYRKWDSGKPFLIPLVAWKYEAGLPSTSVAIHGLLVQDLIQLTNVDWTQKKVKLYKDKRVLLDQMHLTCLVWWASLSPSFGN